MELPVPNLVHEKSGEKLESPHPIWITQNMRTQLDDLKELYGKRAVNKWLRQLWAYGLENLNKTRIPSPLE